MSSLISHAALEDMLGFNPPQGCTRLVSPDTAALHVQSEVSRTDGRLEIHTHDVRGGVDMLRLVLQEQPEGWQIQEQIHSGLAVAPDVKLALTALEQNMCATPLPVQPVRRTPRP